MAIAGAVVAAPQAFAQSYWNWQPQNRPAMATSSWAGGPNSGLVRQYAGQQQFMGFGAVSRPISGLPGIGMYQQLRTNIANQMLASSTPRLNAPTGKVVSVSGNSFVLNSFDGKTWTVVVSSQTTVLKTNNAQGSMTDIMPGAYVKVRGTSPSQSSTEIQAQAVVILANSKAVDYLNKNFQF